MTPEAFAEMLLSKPDVPYHSDENTFTITANAVTYATLSALFAEYGAVNFQKRILKVFTKKNPWIYSNNFP